MRTKISEIIENNSVLETNYISQADANWNDSVKTKFFSEHIEPIRNEYKAFLSTMEEIAGTFERAESVINSLM